ncbi:MAG TPA: FtsX-like permease family protein [Longimicrobiales bacterium]
MTAAFALSHAVRSLLRERQRSLLAVVCIAFGVLSLVSMQLLSSSIRDSMSAPPRLVLGGDARISPADSVWDAQDDAVLADLERAGVIRAAARLAPSQGNLVRREGAARVYFVMRAFGVDPRTWPLAGHIVLADPSPAAVDILSRAGAVIVTRDLARKLGVSIGDAVLLAGEPGAPPARLVVGGVADRLPDRRGDTMLYGLETAALIGGRSDVVRSALVTLRDPADSVLIRDAGWDVMTADASAAAGASIAELFTTMLTGAGLLGLLVGGVGVANTLQVVLARRTPEIATLKTLGYGQRHLLLLFALETGVLGLAGGVAGAAGAVLVGRALTGLMSGMESALLLEFHAPWRTLASGVAIGAVTALVFGLHAIVRTSAVRPAVLLRALPVSLDRRGRLLVTALHGILLLTIFLISALVLGSAVRGLGLTIVAAVCLILLGGVLSLVLRAVLLAPLPGLAAIARRNLARHPIRSAFALIALFAGVFSIAMSATMFINGRDELLARTMDVDGQDVLVFGARADSARVSAVLSKYGTVRGAIDARAVRSGRAGDGIVLRGVDDLQGVRLLPGSTWTGAGNEVILPAIPNDTVSAVSLTVNGAPTAMRVAGRYLAQGSMAGPPAVLAPRATVLRLTGSAGGSAVWSVAVPAARMDAVSDGISSELPGVTVVSPADFRDFMNRVYRGLFRFVAGVSALALLAGAVLIANAVGLSLVERKRELGVLKAIGYGRKHVMSVIALENGLLGCVGGLAGVAGVYVTIAGINIYRPQAALTLAPAHAAVLVLTAAGLAVATAVAVAWRATGLRPLVVLREE